jgi:hypothetical protein
MPDGPSRLILIDPIPSKTIIGVSISIIALFLALLDLLALAISQ